MRRTILAATGACALALAACSSTVPADDASSSAPTAEQTTQSAEATESSEATESAEAMDSSEATESAEATDEATSSGADGSASATGTETHGKVLLTMSAGPQDAESMHGKVVVGQGGCIAFVPIPGGGKPTPLLAPDGATYDGKDTVTIGGTDYRFGQVTDLDAIDYDAKDELPAEWTERCGTSQVLWIAGN